MPTLIQAYRIFIASPGGLQEEREAFREVINEYNEAEAIHRNALFVPVGWELTLGGVGRPQSIINEDVRTSDYLVLLLWNRWGSTPDANSSEFSSGTQEEFHVAQKCLSDANYPMRQIVILFKAVDPQQLSDPGEQLQRVVEFQKKLEEERHFLFHTFDVLNGFRVLLRRHLGNWLRQHEGSLMDERSPSLSVDIRTYSEYGDLAGFEEVEKQKPSSELIKEARELRRAGKRIEAEACYARAVVRGDDPTAFIHYGRFLREEHRFAQSEAMYLRAIELGMLTGNDSTIAKALLGLGTVYGEMGNLDRSAEMQRRALEIFEQLNDLAGSSAASGNIGNILARQKSYVAAKEMYEKSIKLAEQTDRQETIARGYLNLGRVVLNMNEGDTAEQMIKRGFDLSLKTDDPVLKLAAYSTLGSLLRQRGDLAGSERHFKEAANLAEQNNLRYMLPSILRNLSYTRRAKGDSEGARRSLTRAQYLSEILFDQKGVALAHAKLAELSASSGNLQDAESAFRKSIEMYEKLNDTSGVAKNYRRLANVLKRQGKQQEAKELYAKASEISK